MLERGQANFEWPHLLKISPTGDTHACNVGLYLFRGVTLLTEPSCMAKRQITVARTLSTDKICGGWILYLRQMSTLLLILVLQFASHSRLWMPAVAVRLGSLVGSHRSSARLSLILYQVTTVHSLSTVTVPTSDVKAYPGLYNGGGL